jgi:hypothetical protein
MGFQPDNLTARSARRARRDNVDLQRGVQNNGKGSSTGFLRRMQRSRESEQG